MRENIILNTILEIQSDFSNISSYLSKEDINSLKNESKGWFNQNKTLWNDYNWEYFNENIIFGFKSGLIITDESIISIGWKKHPYSDLVHSSKCSFFNFSTKNKYDYTYFFPILNSFEGLGFTSDNFDSGVNFCDLINEKLLLVNFSSGNPQKFKKYFHKYYDNIVSSNDLPKFLISDKIDPKIYLTEKNSMGDYLYLHTLNKDEVLFFKTLKDKLIEKNNEIIIKKTKELNQNKLKFKSKINDILNEFDKDGNGELDTLQIKNDFDDLVKKNQSKIIEVDKSYIQQFVRLSNYQKQKRKNLQTIFESISKTKDQDDLNQQIILLKESIHSYELLLFHSFNMVTCLINNDMFTFFEIYESLDKLSIFNSNHENELKVKLSNIEFGIYNLLLSIRKMEKGIIDELGYLSYVQQESFGKLSSSVESQLNSINSSINFTNLLTSINTYQTYKLRD